MTPLDGIVSLHGDKSVSHRAIILAALAKGSTRIQNISRCDDVLVTVKAMDSLGMFKAMEISGNSLKMNARHPKKGGFDIDCKNSGTTTRLLMGVISGINDVNAVLRGDDSLSKRPMDRVAIPLAAMGAQITTNKGLLPVNIRGTGLHGAEIRSKIPSAQVKSAILFAGMLATGTTRYIETIPTRDHTERLFEFLGIPIKISQNHGGRIIEINGPARPKPFSINIPGDVSNAAVLTALAISIPGSQIALPGVLFNPLRNGFFVNMMKMGAKIKMYENPGGFESTCTIEAAFTGSMADFDVSPPDMVTMIDEIPLFVITAVLHGAKGVIRGIGELRFKESDRVRALLDLLGLLNVTAVVKRDELIVGSSRTIRPERLVYRGMDHRIAFTYILAGRVLQVPVDIEDKGIISVSYPDFYDHMEKLMR